MSAAQLRIQLLISSLSGGGAERVCVLLARGLIDRGHHVTVTTLFGADRDFYRLPEGIERTALNLGGDAASLKDKLLGNLRRVCALRRSLCAARPDVVISFMSQMNVLAVLAACRLAPVVVTEHADPRTAPLGRAWESLRRWTYPRAARLVSVSRGLDACFDWLPAARRTVIHNPIDPAEIDRPGEPLPFPWPRTVISLGRLHREKGFDLLIEAFGRISARFPEWGLAILGEGAERPALQAQIERLGLAGRIHLPGAASNPFPTLKQTDLFVLPSRSEGFGNSLVEALACGLPCLAADCPVGPAEIVTDGVDGLLVPPDDPASLAAGVERLLSDAALRQRLSAQARPSAERFALARIMETWDQLLNEVTGE